MSAWSELAFRNSINSLVVLLTEARGKTKGVPFASITWSRFNGSAALPRSTLSLRAETGSATGRLPCNEVKLDRTSRGVKRGLELDAGSLHFQVVQHHGRQDHSGQA